LDADLATKERALARTAPVGAKHGRFRPTDALLVGTVPREARAAELGIPPGFTVFLPQPGSGDITTREWTYLRKNGSRVPVQLSVSVRRGRHDHIIGFLGVANDITERKAA
jgi:PAS domain-containing protein